MNLRTSVLLIMPLVVTGAIAAGWTFEYRPASVKYAVYGGGLGDPVAPSGADAKVAFAVEGVAAKRLFDAIGPDRKDACSEPGVRLRSRDGDKLACTLTGPGHATCYFGFDLKSGKSIGGSVC